MDIELVIDASGEEVEIAYLRDRQLVEYHKEKSNKDFAVGDFYLGRVKKVVPSLNAAFVDVGYERDAFLHYLDLGPQFASLNAYVQASLKNKKKNGSLSKVDLLDDIDKHGKMGDLLSSGQHVLVQVAKEPISTKGPRLTSEVTLAGRYLVLAPFNNKVSISSNIRDKNERERLRRLLMSIKPRNFGVIIRTVAENKKVADLDADLRELLERWEECHRKLKTSVKPPKKVLGELNKTSAIIRDMLNTDFTRIHVNERGLYQELKNYIREISPDKENIVKLYSGRADIFEQFGIHRQIKASFGRHVPLKSGAHLIIEHTEAMHVVDVNSGNRKSSDKDQEQNALETNLEAAKELARIFRLRDMGGIIAVDFIDMYNKANQKKLYNTFKDYLKEDRAKSNLLPPSKFGVIEVTRERVRPETNIKTAEVCPVCNGTGESQATILLEDEIGERVRHLVEKEKHKKLTLKAHPFVASHLKSPGWNFLKSHQWKWFMQYKKWIRIQSMSAYHFLEYHFFNEEGEEVGKEE